MSGRCAAPGLAAAVVILAACAAPVAPASGPLPEHLGAEPSSIPASDLAAARPSTPASPPSALPTTPGLPTSPAPAGSARDTTTPPSDEPVEEPQAPASDRTAPAPSEPATASDPAPDAATRPPAPHRRIGGGTDRDGDVGIQAPGYADLVEVTFVDEGERLRVRVEVAADLPRQLGDGEVIGLGVELLRAADGESRYQLFADGGADGWLAYLHTPEGFVEYPGTFAIGGRQVEFTVPWTAVGDPDEGPAWVFLDWSGPGPAGAVTVASEDRLPDDGDLHLQR